MVFHLKTTNDKLLLKVNEVYSMKRVNLHPVSKLLKSFLSIYFSKIIDHTWLLKLQQKVNYINSKSQIF